MQHTHQLFWFVTSLKMASCFYKILHLTKSFACFLYPVVVNCFSTSFQLLTLFHGTNIHRHKFTLYFYSTEVSPVLQGSAEITRNQGITRAPWHMKNHKERCPRSTPYIVRNPINIFLIMILIQKKVVDTQFGHNFISLKYIYILIFLPK